jgi:retinoblastoma-like protein 1
MGLRDDADENIFKRHQDLCVNLNMDKDAADEAWQSYETIRQNYTLEVSGSNFEVVESIRFDYFVN